jgi:uncharacterized Zn finger protein (UPF0148 family)
MSETVSVTCPICGATLKIDTEAGVVVDHQAPPEHRDKIDFETRLKQMEEEKRRASDRLAEAMRKEKSRDRILEDKFRELMDKAKDIDDSTPPIRDIDLD